MEQKNSWDIERLQEDVEDIKTIQKEQISRANELENFRVKTVEQLVTIFKQIDKFDNTNRWLVRGFVGTLGGGIITLIFTVIKWAIEN